MSMEKDMKTLKEWKELTEAYFDATSAVLGRISDGNQKIQQQFLPPLQVLKFYSAKLDELLSRFSNASQPVKRGKIGINGEEGMYTVPDNVVDIKSAPRRTDRWSEYKGTPVHMIEID